MPTRTVGEQLLAAIKRKGIPNVTLSADENGHAFIDKKKHPELYIDNIRTLCYNTFIL